jgi:hypothetical protein
MPSTSWWKLKRMTRRTKNHERIFIGRAESVQRLSSRRMMHPMHLLLALQIQRYANDQKPAHLGMAHHLK